jgi:hypothetical protein
LSKSINDFFESRKPEGLARLGLFFDWTDVRYSKETMNMTWDQYVQSNALSFYGEAYRPDRHFNALPVSARDLKGVNNYLFPTHPSEEDAESLRFRMNVAPNAKGRFSSDNQLLNLGFSEKQMKERIEKRYEFSNPFPGLYESFVAENPYTYDLSKKTVFRITLVVPKSNFVSDPVKVVLTRKQLRINTEVRDAVQKALVKLKDLSNIVVEMRYDASLKTFKFSFPINPALLVSLNPAIELANRLGFKFNTTITKRNPESTEKVDDTPDLTEAEKKARALVYDTSIVIVSDENSRSMFTVGISETFMASLMPTMAGTLELSQFCNTMPKMMLPSVFTGSSDVVPATFRLNRFLDHENLVKLQWKHDAYVIGVLKGTAL